MAKIKKFAVIGNPISHSLSPQIHHMFAKQHGINIDYIKIESSLDNFEKDVKNFFDNDGIGMNITLPFKELAFRLSDESDDCSFSCQSCNTLFKKDDKLYSHSTDGLGLIRDLSNYKIDLRSKSVLMLGAGGSAKSIIEILAKAESTNVSIYNRTESKVDEIVKKYKSKQIVKHIDSNKYDLIINCTSVNLDDNQISLPSNIFKNGSIAYDLFYSVNKTRFEDWASRYGATKTINGMGMLIEQAALSYQIWNGFMPSTSEIKINLIS